MLMAYTGFEQKVLRIQQGRNGITQVNGILFRRQRIRNQVIRAAVQIWFWLFLAEIILIALAINGMAQPERKPLRGERPELMAVIKAPVGKAGVGRGEINRNIFAVVKIGSII